MIHISKALADSLGVLGLPGRGVGIRVRMIPEPAAIYVMDRAYVDFERLFTIHQDGALFVTRAKSNANLQRVYSAPCNREQGIICDQTVALSGFYSQKNYPVHLRRIRFKDPDTAKTLVFLTNLFSPPSETICALYKARWHVGSWIVVFDAAQGLRVIVLGLNTGEHDGLVDFYAGCRVHLMWVAASVPGIGFGTDDEERPDLVQYGAVFSMVSVTYSALAEVSPDSSDRTHLALQLFRTRCAPRFMRPVPGPSIGHESPVSF